MGHAQLDEQQIFLDRRSQTVTKLISDKAKRET